MQKAQKQLNDFEEEQNKGYNMRVKGPGKQSKSHYEVFKEDVDGDDIEEDIQSEERNDNQNKLGADSESGRGFGITVSQSLGIDKSVDSLAIDEYDHIEEVEF